MAKAVEYLPWQAAVLQQGLEVPSYVVTIQQCPVLRWENQV